MYQRAVRAGALVPATRPSSLECAHCGVVFVPKSSRSRFCSNRCQRLSKGRPCYICGKPCQVSSCSLAEPAHDACRSAQHGTAYQYSKGCRCDECRRRMTVLQAEFRVKYRERTGRGWDEGRDRDRSREGEFYVPRAERLAIYERDGWVCQLCGEPVDRDAHFNDRRYPSLDHIECQSWVLVPDHRPSNLRTVHRACNSSRRNRDVDVTLPPMRVARAGSATSPVGVGYPA